MVTSDFFILLAPWFWELVTICMQLRSLTRARECSVGLIPPRLHNNSHHSALSPLKCRIKCKIVRRRDYKYPHRVKASNLPLYTISRVSEMRQSLISDVRIITCAQRHPAYMVRPSCGGASRQVPGSLALTGNHALPPRLRSS